MLIVLVWIGAAALHLLLGWMWTPLAAVVAGLFQARWATLRGGLGVMLDWASMLLWSYAVAPRPTGEMIDVLGGILGNMPGAAIVGLTLTLAFMLGALGGLAGGLARKLGAGFGRESAVPEPMEPLPEAPDFDPYQPL